MLLQNFFFFFFFSIWLFPSSPSTPCLLLSHANKLLGPLCYMCKSPLLFLRGLLPGSSNLSVLLIQSLSIHTLAALSGFISETSSARCLYDTAV